MRRAGNSPYCGLHDPEGAERRAHFLAEVEAKQAARRAASRLARSSPKPKKPPRVCSITGCDRPHTGMGYCIVHYTRWHRYGDPETLMINRHHDAICSVDGCDRPYTGHGMCSLHYQRWRKHGDPQVTLHTHTPRAPVCTVEGCERPHQSKGYCDRHYQRFRSHGDPQTVLSPSRGNGRRGKYRRRSADTVGVLDRARTSPGQLLID